MSTRRVKYRFRKTGTDGLASAALAPRLVPGVSLKLGRREFSILSPMPGNSGESELFLVERDGRRFVLKYYFPRIQPRPDIVESLAGLRHPHIASPVEYGVLAGRFFEVLEYAEGGSLLSRMPVRDPEALRLIASQVVEALAYCHARGIIHRDIKPENILLSHPSGWNIVVTDFGIATMLRGDLTRHLTSQAFTFGYAAPELYGYGGRVYVGKEVDYYALGMTLIHLWEGRNPFEGLSGYAISNLTTTGNIRIPRDLPPELSALVRGLTALDYRSRWGRDEVEAWCAGREMPVRSIRDVSPADPGHGEELPRGAGSFGNAMSPRGSGVPVEAGSAAGGGRTGSGRPQVSFRFDTVDGREIEAATPRELASLLERFPEMGTKHLYRGTLARWLFAADAPLFQRITDLVELEYPENREAGLKKAIYLLDPDRQFVSRGGVVCGTPEEIGTALETEAEFYAEELASNPASELYLFLEARGFSAAAGLFRSCFASHPPLYALHLVVILLQDESVFRLGTWRAERERDFSSAPEPIRRKLLEMLLEPDSKLLVWLSRRGFVPADCRGTALDPRVRAAVSRFMPWVSDWAADEGLDDPDARDRFGYAPLHRAVIAGETAKVGRLLESGCSPNLAQNSGWTALHFAAKYRRTDAARLLLEAGADPAAANGAGETPLHTAAGSGGTEVVRLLLAHGASASVKRGDGRTPAELAAAGGYRELEALLSERVKFARSVTASGILIAVSGGLSLCAFALLPFAAGAVRTALAALQALFLPGLIAGIVMRRRALRRA